MNKRAARAKALEGTISIGELRGMIMGARGQARMSNVNPAFPLEKVLDIYEAAIGGRTDAEVPKAWRTDPYSRSGRMKPTGDVLLITNILRDAS